MKMDYSYPLDETMTTEEITDVVHFYTLVEDAYERGVKAGELLTAYRRFKQIVPSKADEKTDFKQFEKASGYACYPVVQKAGKADENEHIHMA